MALLDDVAALDFEDLSAALAQPPARGRHRQLCVVVRQLRVGWPCVCALIRQGLLPKKRKPGRARMAAVPRQRSANGVRAALEAEGRGYLVRGRSDNDVLMLAEHLWGAEKAESSAQLVETPKEEPRARPRRGWAAVFGGDGRSLNRGSAAPERYYENSRHDLRRLESALRAGTVVEVVLLVRWVNKAFQRHLKALCRQLDIPVRQHC